MKFRGLSKWDNPATCRGLVYFSQILEEMLFDYSLDAYKASVMNTGLLCAEALQVIQEIEDGNIRLPNLGHVTEELCSCYEKDEVAQQLLSLPSSAFFPTLKNKKSSLNEIRTVIELLSVQLTPTQYKNKNEELLIDEITTSQSFSRIRRLARSYVTTLIGVGYHQKSIHEISIDFFCFGVNRISEPAAISDFLKLFSAEPTEFDVVFRVGKLFDGLAETFSEMGLFLSKDRPEGIDLSRFPSFDRLPNGELYAVAKKIVARDIYSARNKAEALLNLVSTLVALYHHKESSVWPAECLVYSHVADSSVRIAKPINSMQKCADLIKPVATSRLALLLDDFSLERDSFVKFVRSAQLHSMALTSSTDENQILNLWISLESLVPSETKADDQSNIEHIVSSLVPFLNIGYLSSLLNNLVKDLLRWNGSSVRKTLKNIEGRRFVDRLAKVLILPEYSQQLNSLEACCGDFHLLRDRIDRFKDALSSPANVVALLDAHKTRLEWQIRRIYRVRNIIVHSGRTPPYTKQLIEHTHSYLDTVLSTLIRLASKPKVIHSVSQGFKYVDLQYATYYTALSKKGTVFVRDNVDNLLFPNL